MCPCPIWCKHHIKKRSAVNKLMFSPVFPANAVITEMPIFMKRRGMKVLVKWAPRTASWKVDAGLRGIEGGSQKIGSELPTLGDGAGIARGCTEEDEPHFRTPQLEEIHFGMFCSCYLDPWGCVHVEKGYQILVGWHIPGNGNVSLILSVSHCLQCRCLRMSGVGLCFDGAETRADSLDHSGFSAPLQVRRSHRFMSWATLLFLGSSCAENDCEINGRNMKHSNAFQNSGSEKDTLCM